MTQINEATETFRNSHFIKRGCRKLVEQANKQKEYEFSATEKKEQVALEITDGGHETDKIANGDDEFNST